MEETFVLVTLVSFKELVIAKSRSEIVRNIQELGEFGLDGELDGLSLNEVGKEKFFHSIEIVLARIEAKD